MPYDYPWIAPDLEIHFARSPLNNWKDFWNDQIVLDDVEDYLEDEGIDLSKASEGTKKIGF